MHIEKQRLVRALLRENLSPFAEEKGLYISGFEFSQGSRGLLLQIYLDGDDGVSIAQCAKLTKEFSPILDAEDPIPDAYTLEVSSPGTDRILELPKDFERFLNSHIRIKRVSYKSKLEAVLLGFTDEGIEVETISDTRFINFNEISIIRLHPTDEELQLLIAGANNE